MSDGNGWPIKPGVPINAEQVNLITRLRNTPNWLREEYGHYKDGLKVFDRAPFEAADALEFQSANIVSLRAENARLREAFQKYFGQSEATNMLASEGETQ
jgi:hypothetical protein